MNKPWPFEENALHLPAFQLNIFVANERKTFLCGPHGCKICTIILHNSEKKTENFKHAKSNSGTSLCGICSIFRNKCAGRVPGDALVATHPFSPVPMFVCHGCQSLPALSSFPAYFPVPVCPLCDGTRCP